MTGKCLCVVPITQIYTTLWTRLFLICMSLFRTRNELLKSHHMRYESQVMPVLYFPSKFILKLRKNRESLTSFMICLSVPVDLSANPRRRREYSTTLQKNFDIN